MGNFPSGWVRAQAELVLDSLQRPSAMTPSGYTDTLQTNLAQAVRLGWRFPARLLETFAAKQHTPWPWQLCAQSVFTCISLALSSHANRAGELFIFVKRCENYWLLQTCIYRCKFSTSKQTAVAIHQISLLIFISDTLLVSLLSVFKNDGLSCQIEHFHYYTGSGCQGMGLWWMTQH